LCTFVAVSAFTEYIKGLSPSNLDMELRMFQIIDEDEDEEELVKRPEFISIELLLDYFIHEISCRNNFEFVQAVTRLFLKVWIHHCSFLYTCLGLYS
jgi:U3 small nucleolar RNA-associated protein 21